MDFLNKKRKQLLKLKPEISQKKSKNYIFHGLIDTFSIYCENTNLHGFHYIIENYNKTDNVLKSRCFINFRLTIWIIAVLICSVLSLYLTLLVLHRYNTSPTITTIETNNYLISNIPFPGVTICNINSVYKPKIQPFLDTLMQNGITFNRSYEFMSSLSALIDFRTVDSEFSKYSDIIENNGYSLDDLMLEVAQPCDILLKKCFWLGVLKPCNELFRITKSGFGYCCSFNYQALRINYEVDANLNENNKMDTPLLRISGAGEDLSLRVIVDVEPSNYMSAKRFFYGAEIIIHDPEDFPDKSLLSAFSEPGKEVSIALRPSVVTTVDDVKNLPVNQRFCRFEYEKRLHIARKYSFHSCITECRAKTIMEICRCLPFFYPNQKRNNSKSNIPQCSLNHLNCLNENKHVFSSLHLNIDTNKSNLKKKTAMNCDCLPSCTEKSYNIDTFRSRIINGVRPHKYISDDNASNLSSIVVFFKDFSCIKYRREMFMTWDNLLASFGGIFGLCLGGSILSLVEIFYYITLKLYSNIMKVKANNLNIKNIKIGQNSIAIDLNTGSQFLQIRRKYPKIIFYPNARENHHI